MFETVRFPCIFNEDLNLWLTFVLIIMPGLVLQCTNLYCLSINFVI